MLLPNRKETFGFQFYTVSGRREVIDAVVRDGGMEFMVVPGMVIPEGTEVRYALRTDKEINSISAEFPKETVLRECGKNGNYRIYSAVFSKKGENCIAIDYGRGERCYMNFFVTLPLREIICKRSSCLVNHQQHRDVSKLYNGLFSLYDMEKGLLLSPDNHQNLNSYMVGGSDDPTNGKPLYVSEKNVMYPDREEIADLEYYEENFVWGKLQRTDKEYPYPYGIYGSQNWYRNRSGVDGGYDANGKGKGRMWRTFDYTTHFALYYNLFRIAENNPEWMTYLDADGYLDRAYHTAIAYFTVPYNIKMGKPFGFKGWCDWAYKQGNFHERYILDIIGALEERDRMKEAKTLRREWEKKVTYMVYKDQWPFGSEMFVDRTAFESSYYVGEYALNVEITPEEQYCFDKNEHKWYSYDEPFDPAKQEAFMQNQLDANLDLREIYETGFDNCGTAWADKTSSLDYMSQMGGVAILDYAVNFSEDPSRHIRYGYNSILSSWCLVNTGDKDSGYGYWYPGKEKDGAAGWSFCKQNNSKTWYRVPVNRGLWKHDGEIDHGFVGGVHGAGTYIVKDSVFGEVCYGGVLSEDRTNWKLKMADGVGRNLFVPYEDAYLQIRLYNNGLSEGKYQMISRDLESITLNLELRGASDMQRIDFRNLPAGKYVYRAGKEAGNLESDGNKALLKFPFNGKLVRLVISKVE